MSPKRSSDKSLEVTSQPIQAELSAIKDRLNAIETIQSISNATVVKAYVKEFLSSKEAKEIMAECAESRTKAYLQEKFGYKTSQALDYHLTKLREADLLRDQVQSNRTILLEWSNLFRRLPKPTIKALLKP